MSAASRRPRITVAAGIIPRGPKFLISRRAPQSHLGGLWEFPGGKVERGESPPEALRRELDEELGLSVTRCVPFHREEHGYPDVDVEVFFFLCPDVADTPRGGEGPDARWVTLDELRDLEMPAANRRVVELLGTNFD